MELSARIRKEAKKYGVDPRWLLMADLISIGYTENEVYSIAYPENMQFDKKRLISLREGITFSVEFKNLVRERIAKNKGVNPNEIPTDGEVPQLTKEQVAAQLKQQIDLLPDGSKEKADVLMKYADLFAMKKEEKKGEEEEVIKIWMPLTCDICPYKKNATG